MITITRRQARRLRGIFRRSVMGIGHRGPVPPLVLRAEGAQLRAQHRYAALAVEHAEPGTFGPHESIALPLEALADVEGRDDSPVVLEAAAPDRTVVRWQDHGVPLVRVYTVPALDALAPFPEAPPTWAELPGGLIDALAEAAATGADDSTRYALNCIQLRGDTREVVATDGRQLLVHGGVAFPWPGDVLVKRSPVFASKELPRDRPVSVGKTDTHVVLRAGPWAFHLEIQNARFPRVDRVIPDASAVTTRLRLDPEDAAFLAQALDHLPGADALNSPATLDLNGRVAVRARGADQPGVTELVLSRSGYTGTPARFNANRALLARAVRLGFTEFEVADADSPVVLRDGPRVFCFQPLSKESAIGPTDDVTRVVSCASDPTPADGPGETTSEESTMSERTDRAGHRPGDNEPTGSTDRGNDTAAPGQGGGNGLVALIAEAEALHAALGEAKARAGRLTVALRRHRKRDRLVDSTLASLRALKLEEVSG